MEELASECKHIEKNVETVNEAPIDVHFDITIRDLAETKPNIINVVNPTFRLSNEWSCRGKDNDTVLLIVNEDKILTQLRLRNNFPKDLIYCLDSLSGSDPKTLSESYSLAGLYFKDKQTIIFGTNFDPVRNIYISLSIDIDEYDYVSNVIIHFNNPKKERISSMKRLYHKNNNTRSYLQSMLIGPGANYGEGDSQVVRNIYCDYCGDLICVSSYADYFENDKNRQICKNCKDIPTKNTDTEETRTYAISGTPEQLDTLEALFNEINVLCAMGSSRKICLYVDGDGAVNMRIKPQEGELNNKAAGYGNLKRNSDGYLSYLDLG